MIAMQADPDFEAKYKLPAGVGDGYTALRRTLAAHARALAKPVLLVLHQRRVRGGPANANNAVRLIQSWRANSAFMRASHLKGCAC